MTELPAEVVAVLRRCGVGRRKLGDPFLEYHAPERLGVYDADDEKLCHQLVTVECTARGCEYRATSLQELASHYELSHRFACAECHRAFRSPHLLDLHLQEAHDSFFAVLAEKRPSYCCYLEGCKDKFWNTEERFNHGVSVHMLPKDFRPEQEVSKRTQKKSNKNKKRTVDMETDDKNGVLEKSTAEDKIGPGTSTTNVKPPKHFSFGHGKNKTFLVKKFTNTDVKDKHIDMDVVVSDLKDSLPL